MLFLVRLVALVVDESVFSTLFRFQSAIEVSFCIPFNPIPAFPAFTGPEHRF
jgi:hypothetical protein